MWNERARVTMVTSNSRYHLDDHTHPHNIHIISEYIAPLNGEPTVAFDCLCCKRLYVISKKDIEYRSIGRQEPDIVSPMVETDF